MAFVSLSVLVGQNSDSSVLLSSLKPRPNKRYTVAIGYDSFNPANPIMNGIDTRPRCEVNTYAK